MTPLPPDSHGHDPPLTQQTAFLLVAAIPVIFHINEQLQNVYINSIMQLAMQGLEPSAIFSILLNIIE